MVCPYKITQRNIITMRIPRANAIRPYTLHITHYTLHDYTPLHPSLFPKLVHFLCKKRIKLVGFLCKKYINLSIFCVYLQQNIRKIAMKRYIMSDLMKWKNSICRKPLILEGARQV